MNETKKFKGKNDWTIQIEFTKNKRKPIKSTLANMVAHSSLSQHLFLSRFEP
jgi:hypothetical protein